MGIPDSYLATIQNDQTEVLKLWGDPDRISRLPLEEPVIQSVPAPQQEQQRPPPQQQDQPNMQVDHQRGSGSSAKIATTIHDQPNGSDRAYLSAGDRVTIVGCDDGWCEISRPQRGFVWVDDLNR